MNSWRCADCWFIPYELETDPRPCPRCGCVAFTNGTMHITLKLPMARMTLRRRASGYLSKLFANGPTKDDHEFLRVRRIAWGEDGCSQNNSAC